MKQKRLGNSDLVISQVGLGTWAIGGPGRLGWGGQKDNESIETIIRAVDQGINWIDTAPIYGCGHSEEVIGRALKHMHNRPLIFTKLGITWNDQKDIEHKLTAKSVRKEVENSLRRLRVNVIDMLQIHWPHPEEYLEEAWAEMAEMVREGKIRYLGVSNFTVSQMERIADIAPITSLQPPYNMLSRDVEKEILPYCKEHQIGTIVYSPMASGLLSGKMTRERILSLPEDDWRKSADAFNEPQLSAHLQVVDTLQEIAKEKGCQVPQLAVAWTLQHEAVTGAIVGLRNPQQLRCALGISDIQLTKEDMMRIEEASYSLH